MKYISITSSQEIDEIFKNHNVKSAFRNATTSDTFYRIGYLFEDDKFVINLLAIQIDNTDSYEVFVLFEIDNLCVNSYDEMNAVIANLVDDIASYSKDLLKYHTKKQCSQY